MTCENVLVQHVVGYFLNCDFMVTTFYVHLLSVYLCVFVYVRLWTSLSDANEWKKNEWTYSRIPTLRPSYRYILLDLLALSLVLTDMSPDSFIIMPPPLAYGALSDDARLTSVWRLSVAYIGPKSRT